MAVKSMESVQTSSVSDILVTFIKENFITGRNQKEIAPDQSLIDSGIIDSTGILELVMFLEEKYSITIEDEELIPENLDSVKNLVAFLERKGVR
jgi:acyl carrier protein